MRFLQIEPQRKCAVCGKPITTTILRLCASCTRNRRGL